jgi:hypothetical protein
MISKRKESSRWIWILEQQWRRDETGGEAFKNKRTNPLVYYCSTFIIEAEKRLGKQKPKRKSKGHTHTHREVWGGKSRDR